MRKLRMGFVHAFVGLLDTFSERNMKFHLVVSFVVIALGIILGVSRFEWVILFLTIGLVLSAEMFNTAIEEVCNRIRDDLGLSYEATRKARDVSAGAVLVMAFIAMLVGFLIFIPKIVDALLIRL